MERLPKPRHTDHVVGFYPLQIRPQLAQVGVALAAAPRKQQVAGTAFVGVPDRQHTQHPVPRLGVHRHPEVAQLVQQVCLAERHPLRAAGGARGVKQRCQALFWAHKRFQQGPALPQGQEARPIQQRHGQGLGQASGGSGGLPLE